MIHAYLKAYANHLKGVQVIATISLHFLKYIQCLLAEISMIGRAYMGEVLTQVWLKSIKMSELFDKEVNAQKVYKKLPGSRKAPASPQKSVR